MRLQPVGPMRARRALSTECRADMDVLPRVLGSIESLGVRGYQDQAEARVRVTVCRETGGVDVVAVPLVHRLGGEIVMQYDANQEVSSTICPTRVVEFLRAA